MLLSAEGGLMHRLCVQCLTSTYLDKAAVITHKPFRLIGQWGILCVWVCGGTIVCLRRTYAQTLCPTSDLHLPRQGCCHYSQTFQVGWAVGDREEGRYYCLLMQN